MEPIDRDVSSVRAFFLTNSDTGNSKGTATPLSPGCLHGSLDISKTCNTSIPSNTVLPNVKNAATDDAVEKGSSCMLPTGTTSGSIDACAGTDSSTTVAVGTVIVGRRFHENIELQEGLGVTVLRDPQNAKDPDAIKMLYARSECEQMLGYLPRELAKVLAPLPGKHYVECKGFMVTLPEQQLDNVPIQLAYQKCKNDNQRYDDLKYQLSLWENFVGAVRNGNLQRPSSARYKTNFSSMIADVMANHTHLCSDKEPSF